MTATDGLAPSAGPLGPRLGHLLGLAWPIVLSRSGIMLMAMVDIIMVGRFSTEELAYASLGFALFIPVLVSGIGLLIGVAVLTAQAYGAGRYEECGEIWRRGMPWAAAIGVVGAVFLLFGETWLRAFGQTPEMAAGGGVVAQMLSVGLIAQLFFVVTTFHLEGTRRPRPAMVAMIAANLLNVALNWMLIYGNLGFPPMGAVGSAIATSAVRIFLLAAVVAVLIFDRNGPRFGVTRAAVFGPGVGFWGRGGWAGAAPLRRLGMAAGASFFVETSAYGAVMQFAGWLGEVELGAYTIAHNVEATCFMVALGFGSATAVLVGGAVGACDYRAAGAASRLGLAAGLGALGALAVGILLFLDPIAALYTQDPRVAALTATVLALSAVTILADGAQIIMGQSVRALGDAWIATALYALAFWGGTIPLAYLFGVAFEIGAFGLLLGILCGCTLSFALLAWRFALLCRRGVDAGPAAEAAT